MRVLVAAVRADGGRTSEGACTARVLRLLVARGHDVRLLVGGEAEEPGGAVEVARAALGGDGVGVPVDEVVARSTSARVGRWARARGGRFRPDLPVQLATGAGLDELAARRAWRTAVERHAASHDAQVVLARGAGLDLGPVLALAGSGLPWVAHLHDPWPSSWYPPSYAEPSRVVSHRQVAALRRALRSAAVVTAPSRRLLAWMGERSGLDLAARGHVLAHLGPPVDEPPATEEDRSAAAALRPDRPFVLAHAGTLLGPRRPGPLLEALDRLRTRRPQAADDVGLAVVGPSDRRHRALLAARGDDPGVAVHDGRVPGPVARELVAGSAVAVVLEAADPESPFFPAKLADVLCLGRPVLALSPTSSVASDLLGAQHPLRVAPDDVAGIATALELAWEAWRAGSLTELGPPAPARAAVGSDAVGVALDEVLAAAIS